MRHVAAIGLVASLGLLCFNLTARGDDREQRLVDFDVRLSFPGKDVTPDEFARANPGIRVLEVRIPISSNFSADEFAVEKIVHRIRVGPDVDIVDFLPKTELGAELAAPYVVGETSRTQKAEVTSLVGGAQVGFKITGVDIEASGTTARKNEKAAESSSEVEFHVLPPKKTIVAAGTEDRGHTVYFELKPFSQATLKGQREFVLLIAVPSAWKGGCYDLESSVSPKKPNDNVIKQMNCFAVYRSGDLEAKSKHEELVSQRLKPGSDNAKEDAKIEAINICGNYVISSKAKFDRFSIMLFSLNDDGTWEGVQGTGAKPFDESRARDNEKNKGGLLAVDMLGISTMVEDNKVKYRGRWTLVDGALILDARSYAPWRGSFIGGEAVEHMWVYDKPKSLLASNIKSVDEQNGNIKLTNDSVLIKVSPPYVPD